MKYKNAVELAKAITPQKDARVFVLVDGTFIFGDFIEAFITEHNLHVDRLVISTLSLSQSNVDSLRNLLEGDYVDALDMLVSDYFFAHERHKNGLVPYMYKELDINNSFQLSAASVHCKMCLIKTHCGLNIVIHGSANLRSSSNVEQFVFEEGRELFDFNLEWIDSVIEKYKTIKKSLRGPELWEAATNSTEQDAIR